MSNLTYIYTLEYPEGNIRYVGKSDNPKKRFKRHLEEGFKNTLTHKKAWLNGLLTKGEKPILNIIDEVSKSDWVLSEQYWISQFRSWGFSLVNSTIGGDGNVCTCLEIKDKMRNTLLERYDSGDIVVWNKGLVGVSCGWEKGKNRTEENKQQISKTKKEYYKENDPWNKGLKGFQEAWNKGGTWSDEIKEKFSKAHKGKKLSEKHKQSLKDAYKIKLEYVCPWCNKSSKNNRFLGWHFDNCKFKKDVEVKS